MAHPLRSTAPPFSDLLEGNGGVLLLAMGVTLFVGWRVVAHRQALSRLMRDRDDARAKQCSHVGNPPRLGGVTVVAGLGAGIALGNWSDSRLPLLLLLSAAPAFLVGLLEDCGYPVSALWRLAAAFVSAALAMIVFGTWVTRGDLPGLDPVMTVVPVAILLTLMLSAGFCHATNLVDGMNGLVGAVLISGAAGLSGLAHAAGEGDLALLTALLAAAMSGFLLFNWPHGALFMGDAGCYGLGHVLIWIAILLADRVPSIAAPAFLLILFWPLADAMHSILRRLIGGTPIFAPDRLHLHQKMRRCIEIAVLGGAQRRISNPLAILVLLPLLALPVGTGVFLARHPGLSWLALLLFGLLFALTHVVITRLALTRRRTLAAAGQKTAWEGNSVGVALGESKEKVGGAIYEIPSEPEGQGSSH
jgi:UDP-N-acetylmuramyl pentapeptide phosphotransferase/UDP-N-acetylglucosamine-1-phosphate transferase